MLKLTNHLLPRKNEIEKELSSLEISSEEANVDGTRAELEAIKAAMAKSQESYNTIEQQINEKTVLIDDELKERIESLKEQESDGNRKLQDESKLIEKLLNNRSLLLQKKDNIQNKLRDVGSLPTKTQTMYQDQPIDALLVQLQKTKQTLRTFKNVNKKALDQYVHFKEQREDLDQRKVELDQSEQAINHLISVLDQKKDEAIERTFKMVAKFFSEVFAELTGDGSAQLVMQKKLAEEGTQASSVQQYKGVDIKVSFTRTGKEHRIHQLSGGQQSLVALALIFAIQRCDPAPFYVFDEIDAALDDTHRKAVAEMISRQSKQGIQFILTTHRPELIGTADKHYLIKYTNGSSFILSCQLSDALQVVEAEATEIAGQRATPGAVEELVQEDEEGEETGLDQFEESQV